RRRQSLDPQRAREKRVAFKLGDGVKIWFSHADQTTRIRAISPSEMRPTSRWWGHRLVRCWSNFGSSNRSPTKASPAVEVIGAEVNSHSKSILSRFYSPFR